MKFWYHFSTATALLLRSSARNLGTLSEYEYTGLPNGCLELQMALWSFKWPYGAPKARLELQMAVRRFRMTVWNFKSSSGG